jgi:Holliday junction DNA helicase RuvA
MIGRLCGELADLEGSLALIDCGGVGYEVTIPDHVALSLGSIGSQVELMIRQVIREDSNTLYGFRTPFQRRVFDLLVSVSGCGPKSALSLLGQVGEDAVCGAIVSQDAKTLARASGIGARTAERIIVELKDKVAEVMMAHRIPGTVPVAAPKLIDSELTEALLALGYRRNEIEAISEKVSKQSKEIAEQIRLALAELRA